ncbi:hypothetical protein CN936_09525 [Bacillus cereus]|jgi:hypothetical protein|uniref:hypothetical protein n=1 Tax=Bacillus cereus group TaxID=86661 RepID=UPI00065BC80E|nr:MULTISPECIES: hypothetical protein [Bacillus cereus group]ANN35624.1 hypothetical protein A9498_30065 [Bacillus thuringiensis serovar coreanensis]KMQ23991.1 hypothetical protein TU58_24345 [Bacillus cereus]MBT2200784.1 hypothetical protein [Bacillus thuringiensis]PDY05022.1 hypothetical protein COM66_14940 [Bacillus cereus]PFR41715.1 hypothetical protein COK29_32180 [Bacillus cereus]
MFKQIVVSALTLGGLVIGGISANADEHDRYFGGCKNVTQNVEANEYVKNCFKIFPNPPLGPNVIKIPKSVPYDDGTYQGTLYLVSQNSTMYSIVANFEGTLKKYK